MAAPLSLGSHYRFVLVKLVRSFPSRHGLPTQHRRPWSTARIRRRVIATLALTAVLALLAPTAAGAQASNLTRSGPNLKLVVANCASATDTALAQFLADNARHAAAACIEPDGLPAETAALIADFAPDSIVVIGGEAAVSAAAMQELRSAARAQYLWTSLTRLGGASRVDTAAAVARAVLGTPRAAGADTVTLVVADGWSEADVDSAREFAEGFEDVAIAYFSPTAVADGLAEATASLITDYRPARIVFAGAADEAGRAAEAAAAAVVQTVESDVSVERVALAGTTPSPSVDTAALARSARDTFNSINAGKRSQPGSAHREQLPLLALTEASGLPGVGSTLYTVRADGSDRVLRTVDHNGWEWHPSDGRLAWSDDGERVVAAAPSGPEQVLVEQGIWPLWSPNGSRLIVFDVEDLDDDGFADRATATMSGAQGMAQRSLGFVDLRTWYYADIEGGMWSTDGMHLAYVTGDIDQETSEMIQQVRVEPTDASTAPVTLADEGIVVRWSPEGNRLLYATPQDCGDGEADDIWDLWVTGADGSDPRRIDTITFPEWSVLIINPWSPDGRHVAYEAIDPQDCSTELRVATISSDDEDGSAPVSIAADVSFLGWSPDSTYLEYGVKTDRPVTDYLLPELSWVAHRDGSSKRSIGELSPSAYGWIFWSDDGTHISYTEMLRDADGNVTGLVARTQRADGEGDITTLAQPGNSLSWSGDGRVAYVAQHDDGGDGVPEREALYIHTPGSPDGDVELVHSLPAPTRVAIWSPDSSHLIYASGSIESLIGWFRDRGRGVNVWGIETSEPRWMHRLITDVTWGEWQPAPATD